MGPAAFPQNLILKDGLEAFLMPLRPGEMGDLQAFFRTFPEEERMVLTDDVTTPEWGKRVEQAGKQPYGDQGNYRSVWKISKTS